MAKISKIVLPDSSEYEFYDKNTREDLSALSLSVTNSIRQVDNKVNDLIGTVLGKVSTSDYITTEEINQIWEAN